MSKEYSPPNHPLGLLNLDETSIINLGKAVRGSPREMGLVGLVGGGVHPHHGCGRTLVWPNRPHLPWVDSNEVCELAHDGLAQS